MVKMNDIERLRLLGTDGDPSVVIDAVLQLADELAEMQARVDDLDLKYGHPLYTVDSNGMRLGVVRDALDHIIDEME